MSTFEIEGGVPLRGTVRASGNKNAILPIIAACILTDQEMVLDNVPDIVDVRHMLELIVEIGGRVERSGERVSIQVASVKTSEVSRALCNKVRTSILCLAPLLHRLGKARVYPPGGDVIGRRRLDTHFYGLQKLGATVSLDGHYDFQMHGPLTGAEMFFDDPSVTGTEHVLMAAVVSRGQTLMRNAACEPHVQDLAHMLNAMGARISGIGTNLLTIEGVPSVHGTTHTVCHARPCRGGNATLVPDSSGLALTTSRRLAEMSKAGSSYTLGPAERLLPILEAGQSGDRATLEALTPTSVLTPLWQDDLTARRQKLATLVVELIRANKRILLVTS